jgi:[acyl-carrier-protein] S-malonyltransferase
MGRDFFEGSAAAREVLEEAAALSPPGFMHTLFEGSPEKLAQPHIVQPALFALEVAIARHLIARGIVPTGCAGHSFGEVPALVIADAFDFEPAFIIAHARGRWMETDVPDGGMAAVLGLPPEDIERTLPEGVTVANYNGPRQTIVSGTRAGLQEAEKVLKEAGARRFIMLKVAGPFHSPHMRSAELQFRKEIEDLDVRSPRIRFVSSVSGEEVTDPETIRDLLGHQICRPVLWTDVMLRVGPVRAIEVGPGRVLQGLAKRIENAPTVETAGTLAEADALEVAP